MAAFPWEDLPYLVSSGIVGHEFYLRNDTGGYPLATNVGVHTHVHMHHPTLLQCLCTHTYTKNYLVFLRIYILSLSYESSFIKPIHTCFSHGYYFI